MRKKKRKLKPLVIVIFTFICLGGLIYSGYNIFVWLKSVKSNDEIKQEIDDYIKIVDTESEVPKYIIDFNSLEKENNDTVAYLKVNGTNIDYIIVKGNDNSYYLNHNFGKEYSVAGWIFADYHNKYDGSDKNLVIYGHNTSDGSMFGTLKDTLSSAWQKNNKNNEILFITRDNTYTYQVFSTYMIEPEDYYINTEFKSDEEYEKFLRTIKSRSNYDYGVDVLISDKILTLSTCSDNGSKRVVLHAKLVIDN